MEGYEQEPDTTTTQQPAKRETFLTVLCILTFISCGLGIMRSLIITPLADFMIDIVKQSPKYDADMYTELFTLLKAGWGYYLVNLLLVLLELTGAVMMWNLKKNGFHFYTIANILLLYIPVTWLGLEFNYFEGFLTAAFVTMYAMQMRYMR
ncbi:MAG: hypothetical protein JWO09_970 [Bacteroidetes bacterium]|nr:hypothetical protein [Bacteroidota bacterium]